MVIPSFSPSPARGMPLHHRSARGRPATIQKPSLLVCACRLFCVVGADTCPVSRVAPGEEESLPFAWDTIWITMKGIYRRKARVTNRTRPTSRSAIAEPRIRRCSQPRSRRRTRADSATATTRA